MIVSHEQRQCPVATYLMLPKSSLDTTWINREKNFLPISLN
jgi:hypothetical protein